MGSGRGWKGGNGRAEEKEIGGGLNGVGKMVMIEWGCWEFDMCTFER